MRDDAVMDILQGKRSLREVVDDLPVKRPAEPNADQAELPDGANTALPDDVLGLPGPSDAYKARSRPANRPVPSLHLILADASSRGFSYHNLDTVDLVPAKEPGRGPALVLRFAGIVPQEITITGRKLEVIRDYIGYHRLAWLWQLPPSRDFVADGEEVITEITIRRIEFEG